MMKMNTGAWIGIGAGIAGFLVAILAVVMTAGSEGIYIIIGMIALFGGIGFLFYKLLFGPMINASRLHKVGIPGKAIVTDVRDTGVTINNNPQVKLTLELKNSFGQRYTTICRTLVSRINPFVFHVGMEVPVKIDPKNEKNVIIDTSGNTRASMKSSSSYTEQTTLSATEIANLQSELEKMQQYNEEISRTGRSARAIVKKYNWLGSYVNGNNPYVELELEVLPDASPSFSGTAKGVIAEASVQKYQPGSVIYVKYDLYDNTKIAIERS